MRRAQSATTLISALLLAGCASGAGPAPEALEPTTSATESSSPSPNVGTYPGYPYDDYAYTLSISCFCPDAGVPYRITVRDDEVVQVAYVRRTRGHAAGDPVKDRWLHVTMDDIIDAANETEAAQVKVAWPSGQDHPESVWVDRDKLMVDEEIGYSVSDVVPGD